LQVLQDGANNPHTHFSLQEHHEPLAKPMQTPGTDLLQQQKKYTTSAPLTKKQQNHQMRITPILSTAQNRVPTSPSNLQARINTDTVDAGPQQQPGAHTRGACLQGTTLAQMDTPGLRGIISSTNQENSAKAAMSTPNSNFPVKPPISLPGASMNAIAVMAAILGNILLATPSSPGSTASPLFSFPTGYRYWNYHRPSCQAQLAKSRTSYLYWITTIIQQCWDTAWDLTTHHNIERRPR